MGFERIVTVDWSASSSPKLGADSIWISIDEDGAVADPENLSTRAAAVDRLVELCGGPGRTLVAVDWSLGYPSGTAETFRLDGSQPAWRATHDYLAGAIADFDDNRNDRFAVANELNVQRGLGPGPFWGAPASGATDALTTTKPTFDRPAEWREVEH
ncbi:MAG: hypothetical protein AAFP84_21045, partial [Actinomycetota bacterium]